VTGPPEQGIGNGFHDSANSISTIVATRVLRPRLAVLWAAWRPPGIGWTTGHKTSNGRIATTAQTDTDLPTILELAQARGFRAGDVSTAELTDATPAVLAAHVAARSCPRPAGGATTRAHPGRPASTR
jgi:hypothetical protein